MVGQTLLLILIRDFNRLEADTWLFSCCFVSPLMFIFLCGLQSVRIVAHASLLLCVLSVDLIRVYYDLQRSSDMLFISSSPASMALDAGVLQVWKKLPMDILKANLGPNIGIKQQSPMKNVLTSSSSVDGAMSFRILPTAGLSTLRYPRVVPDKASPYRLGQHSGQ